MIDTGRRFILQKSTWLQKRQGGDGNLNRRILKRHFNRAQKERLAWQEDGLLEGLPVDECSVGRA